MEIWLQSRGSLRLGVAGREQRQSFWYVFSGYRIESPYLSGDYKIIHFQMVNFQPIFTESVPK